MPYYITNIHGRYLKAWNVCEYTFTRRQQDALSFSNKPKAFSELCDANKAHTELRLSAVFEIEKTEDPQP